MAERYPEIEPYESGFLDVGDGHELYWETVGDPAGTPAVWLHGGPGSGCTPGHRRAFDPAGYRAVLFDQRGCGRRSRPLADSALDTAWDLHKVWPASRLVVCQEDGHSGSAMTAAVVDALDTVRGIRAD